MAFLMGFYSFKCNTVGFYMTLKRLEKKTKKARDSLLALEKIEQFRQQHYKKQLDYLARVHSSELPPSKISVSLRVPAPLLNNLDYQAALLGISRSELIILALSMFNHAAPYIKQTGDFHAGLQELELI